MDIEVQSNSGNDELQSFKAFLIQDIRSKGMTPEELIEALADSHLELERVIREYKSGVKNIVSMALEYSNRTVSRIETFKADAIALDTAAEQLVSGIDAYATSALLQGFEAGRKKAPTENAHKRHAEHRAIKADVFKWLDSQPSFKRNEAAATAITRQQPIAHSTARDWYKEWKKLRSASTL